MEAVYKCSRYGIGVKVSVFLEMNPEEGTMKEFEDENDILDLRSHRVCVAPQLPTKLIKGQEESHEKRAATLAVDTGKVFLKRKGCLVKVVIAADDQR